MFHRNPIWPSGRELQNLLSPLRVREFLAQYWGRKPLYIPGTRRKFADLKFDLVALENVIRDAEPRDRLQVRFVGADDKEKQRPTDLEHYSIRDGNLTVCANWINDRFDSLMSYCAGIKTALSLPGSVFMTCYASPHGLGFGTHWDCSASFILQIEGSKRWRFSARPAVQWPPTLLPKADVVNEMMDRYPWLQVQFPEKKDEATFLEQVLKPGDVLFLPAGTWHKASAIGYSLALTVACPPKTAADFVDDVIRGHLSSSVHWRSNLPPVPMEATPPDRLPPVVKRFLDARLSELRKHVQSLRAEDLYETWTHHVAAFDTPFKIDDHRDAQEVKPTDTLTLAHDFPLRYVARPGHGSVSLYYLDNRIDLAYEALPLVKTMLKRSTFPAHLATEWLGEEFDWQDVKPVLQELVQAGVLRIDRVGK
jgi:ribosomal protein L16 Arg81 hydroxylase